MRKEKYKIIIIIMKIIKKMEQETIKTNEGRKKKGQGKRRKDKRGKERDKKAMRE